MCTYECKRQGNTASKRGLSKILADENEKKPWVLVRIDCKTQKEESVLCQSGQNAYFTTQNACNQKMSNLICKHQLNYQAPPC